MANSAVPVSRAFTTSAIQNPLKLKAFTITETANFSRNYPSNMFQNAHLIRLSLDSLVLFLHLAFAEDIVVDSFRRLIRVQIIRDPPHFYMSSRFKFHPLNPSHRLFSTASHKYSLSKRFLTSENNSSNTHQNKSFFANLGKSWRDTKVEWYSIPVGLGIAVVGIIQLKKTFDRENNKIDEKIKVHGPWQASFYIFLLLFSHLQVYVISTLPLRSISKIWGYINAIDMPVWMRVPGFKLYAWIFGCNLQELAEPNLGKYKNLADFFYRSLAPDARKIDQRALLVSPSDGTILHFGKIKQRQVEQVKGLSYSLDALLGSNQTSSAEKIVFLDEESFTHDEDFAKVNGITYSVDTLIGQDKEQQSHAVVTNKDAFIEQNAEKKTADLLKEVGFQTAAQLGQGNDLYFVVVYLAPGDYHRFHSPVNWVVEKRRHFAGELFSVSPWMAKRLGNLFVLNERVVLLGRWRHGFFSMTPVGATNVGSIRINFDHELKTNTMAKQKPENVTYAEATYEGSSVLLRGHPVKKGQEMGGFSLGSTIVLVFEAPQDFSFNIHIGQKVLVGQSLGDAKREND
ncbi:Phosphatidylserine decarboxylase proenzyme 1, mitochondrial [Neolecta irregularis DAH-3]|uniref:Phosphatidylserine decarboxylase proenzyme 1, mitochondrial n=1 Tax=Neolecta irregularis (strain DAH-3) TaxID=1198029 RepID=A0A1U7LNN9_NEOID|nr:Phosphatidylserine decarboxylase proenzyme 1, mitochondrial [Neolecta irregularis DAH-3]|eukprot:OLL24267.1 Phosphatidylserine decarboxylase proenzyme 1, mitochondrial [Neolecta irregularis DAH-3]